MLYLLYTLYIPCSPLSHRGDPVTVLAGYNSLLPRHYWCLFLERGSLSVLCQKHQIPNVLLVTILGWVMITVNFVYFYSMKSNNLLQCHLKPDVKGICRWNIVWRLPLMREKGAATMNRWNSSVSCFILVISKGLIILPWFPKVWVD